jgi:hypothetical protein
LFGPTPEALGQTSLLRTISQIVAPAPPAPGPPILSLPPPLHPPASQKNSIAFPTAEQGRIAKEKHVLYGLDVLADAQNKRFEFPCGIIDRQIADRSGFTSAKWNGSHPQY